MCHTWWLSPTHTKCILHTCLRYVHTYINTYLVHMYKMSDGAVLLHRYSRRKVSPLCGEGDRASEAKKMTLERPQPPPPSSTDSPQHKQQQQLRPGVPSPSAKTAQQQQHHQHDEPINSRLSPVTLNVLSYSSEKEEFTNRSVSQLQCDVSVCICISGSLCSTFWEPLKLQTLPLPYSAVAVAGYCV